MDFSFKKFNFIFKQSEIELSMNHFLEKFKDQFEGKVLEDVLQPSIKIQVLIIFQLLRNLYFLLLALKTHKN